MTKFLSRWRLLILVAAIAVAGVFVAVEPAEAGFPCDNFNICGTVKHYSPDAGYDAPIAIRCNLGTGPTKFVYEGQSSKLRCHDTDEVYVRDNEEFVCRTVVNGPHGDYYTWQRVFDAKGWHKITDEFNRSCVLTRD
jgi:hypothetical protein